MCTVMGPAPSFVLIVIIKPSSVTKLTGECVYDEGGEAGGGGLGGGGESDSHVHLSVCSCVSGFDQKMSSEPLNLL